jgi:hypothetical protein
MSYRYCIGRHTIAAHMHAGNIADHAYGRMTEKRTLFMSEDINHEISHILNIHDWFTIDNEWSVPPHEFKPLNVLYRCLDDNHITTNEELRKIKNISAYYDNGWKFHIYRYQDGGSNVRSLSDIHDLEVWQQLANLFDLDSHKWCRLTDGTICEYYECWRHYYRDDHSIGHRLWRIPVDAGFNTLTYIPDESIAEDDVKL